MANDREPEIEQLWRQQPLERQTMPLEEIRRKAEDFDRRTERWRIVGGLAVALLLVKNAWEIWVDTDLVERAGDCLMLLALLSMAYLFWRRVRAEGVPSAPGVANCLEYYRSRLMWQRDLSRDGWKYILPFAPGLGLIIIGRALEGRPPSQVLILIAIAIALFAGSLLVIAHGTRTLEREIADLE